MAYSPLPPEAQPLSNSIRTDGYCFTPSVGPHMEAAIILWSELSAWHHQGLQAMTPPPVPVMVAAMLRRPVLEEAISAARNVHGYPVHKHYRRPEKQIIEQLCSGRCPPAPWFTATAPNHVAHSSMYPEHELYLSVLMLSGDVDATVVGIRSMLDIDFPKFNLYLLLSATAASHELPVQFAAVVAAVGDGFVFNADSMPTLAWFPKVFRELPPNTPASALPDRVSNLLVDCTGRHLLGDMRSLLLSLPIHDVTPQDNKALLDRILSRSSAGDGTSDAAVSALQYSRASDMALMVLVQSSAAAAQGRVVPAQSRIPSVTTNQAAVVQTTNYCNAIVENRSHELRCIAALHGIEATHFHLLLGSSRQVLLPVWHTDGTPSLLSTGDRCIDDSTHILLRKHRRIVEAGAAAVVDRTTFTSRWKELTKGLLDGWDWSNCVAAGGAVVACLDPATTTMASASAPTTQLPSGDIDLFFYGLPRGRLQRKAKALQQQVERVVGRGHYVVLLTSRTMTIVTDQVEMPRIQVSLGLWSSIEDVLSTGDVDCCSVGYTAGAGTSDQNVAGSVFATARGWAAWATRLNAGMDSLNAIRGSVEYELRLWKYAVRNGFGVLAPNASGARAPEALLALGAFGSDSHREQRGLAWMSRVDACLFDPGKDSLPNDLQLTEDPPYAFWDMIGKVSSVDYREADNYGQAEEGYAMVFPWSPATTDAGADTPSPSRMVVDVQAFDDDRIWMVPRLSYHLEVDSFHFHLPFSDLDGVRNDTARNWTTIV